MCVGLVCVARAVNSLISLHTVILKEGGECGWLQYLHVGLLRVARAVDGFIPLQTYLQVMSVDGYGTCM